MDYRVISIGALGRHELWEHDPSERSPHATTTLIRSGDHVILVDPGLPAQVIAARLKERAGLSPSDITDVFLTNFRPSHRWGIQAFPDANWLISEMEREAIGRSLIEHLKQEEDPKLQQAIELDVGILKKCQAAPDRLANQVDLFPLPGFTPGTCGLLLCQANSTTLVAGDAVPTVEHLEKGRILNGGFDLAQARESFMEAIEIADVIIPGHDNLLLNPTRRPM